MSASYPTGVKTFVTRNAGDVIQPGHINDIQDEVNALEAGLLQGTAPLNSSNSTVLHLNVSAGMQVVGNSTFGSTMTIGGIPYQFPSTAPSTGQLLVCSDSGTPNVLSWRSVAVNAFSLAGASNTDSSNGSSIMATLKTVSGLTIPATSGVKVMCNFRKSSGASDGMLIRLTVNGQAHVSTMAVTQTSTALATGFLSFEINPRDANYPARISGKADAVAFGDAAIVTNAIPTNFNTVASTVTGVITSIGIDARNANGAVKIFAGHLKVWELAGV